MEHSDSSVSKPDSLQQGCTLSSSLWFSSFFPSSSLHNSAYNRGVHFLLWFSFFFLYTIQLITEVYAFFSGFPFSFLYTIQFVTEVYPFFLSLDILFLFFTQFNLSCFFQVKIATDSRIFVVSPFNSLYISFKENWPSLYFFLFPSSLSFLSLSLSLALSLSQKKLVLSLLFVLSSALPFSVYHFLSLPLCLRKLIFSLVFLILFLSIFHCLSFSLSLSQKWTLSCFSYSSLSLSLSPSVSKKIDILFSFSCSLPFFLFLSLSHSLSQRKLIFKE
ncbi:E7.6.2.1 [Acanthosepion pharaonis]|uniref:E7.6.2.1 n=1 Tax=Acanthosepion pharaonis TaxID=158019 RepID=A0A812DMB6_ACAPH|nr:E7.6.2.1 [Sepia pharaonis]